jgi:hypothetical protein
MLKKVLGGLVVFLLLTVSLRADGAPSLSSQTKMLAGSTLPGIPLAFEVTISNESGNSAALANSLEVKFRRNGGEQATTRWPGTGDFSPLPDESAAGILKPGESRRLYFPSTPFVGSNFAFNDPQMLRPGKYIVDVNVGGAAPSRAEYVVRDVSGVDAEVWSYMQSLVKDGQFAAQDWLIHGGEIAAFIADGRSLSAYKPYATLLTMSSDSPDDGVTVQFEGALRGEATLRVASLHLKRAEKFAAALEFSKAANESDLARALLETVAGSQYLTDMAKAMAKTCFGQRQYEDSYQWRLQYSEPTPKQVEPFVDCIERTDTTLTAHFGYRNPNSTAKGVLAGPKNQVTPPPLDAGQPKLLQPGEHHNVFRVTAGAEEVLWHLDGGVAAARRSSSPCP